MIQRTLLFIILLAGASVLCFAQNESLKENPRGVYRLIDFIGRKGITFEPSEEGYKICTDSMTLSLNVAYNRFEFNFRDGNRVFDYTGEEPDVYDDPLAPRIYDSNAQRFTLKWWSVGYTDMPLFPTKDWCIEHYEADKFSEQGKWIVKAFMSPDFRDENNPLIGVWHPLGTVSNPLELNAPNSELQFVGMGTNAQSCILAPSMLLNFDGKKGSIQSVSIINKDSLQLSDGLHKVTWVSPDTIAIALQSGHHVVWKRDVGGKPLIARIPVPFVPTSGPQHFMIFTKRDTEWMELLAMDEITLTKKCCELIESQKKSGVITREDAFMFFVYAGGAYWKDMAKVYEHHSGLPLEYVQTLNAMYDTPQVRTANAHLKLVKKNMEDVLSTVLKDASKKGRVPAQLIAKECPDSYKTAFQQYYSSTLIKDVMMRKMEVLVDGMEEKDKKKTEKLMPAIQEYIQQQMSVMLCNTCLGIMTEEDLKTLTSIATSQEGKSASTANLKFAKMMNVLFNKEEEGNEATAEMEKYIFDYGRNNTKVVRRTY